MMFKYTSINMKTSSDRCISSVVRLAIKWITILLMMTTVEPVRATQQSQGAAEHEDIQTTNQKFLSTFVRFMEAPGTLGQDSRIKVEYYCEVDSVVVVDLTIMLMDSDQYFTVVSKAWRCLGHGQEGMTKTKVVHLRLPDPLVYRPDYFNKDRPLWLVSGSKFRAWLVDEVAWQKERSGDVYGSSKWRDFSKVIAQPPYSRPYKTPSCTTWIWSLIQKQFSFSDTVTCAKEEEYVTLLDYPAVFNGYAYSIIREFSPFKNPDLERDRLRKRYSPQFSLEMWVYILDYCPLHHLSPAGACGLFIHMDGQGHHFTPAIVISKEGHVQVDVKVASGHIAMKSMDSVPRNTWTRFLFTFHDKTWFLHVNYGPDLTEGFWTSHTYTEDMYVDDTFGMMSVGGLDWTIGSFVGYIGRVVYHRTRFLTPEQLSRPSPSHPMFELHLARRQEKCEHFLSWMDAAVDVYQRYRRYVLAQQEELCPHKAALLFSQFLTNHENVNGCPMKQPFNLRNHHHVGRHLQKVVLTHSLSSNFLDGDVEAYSRSFSSGGRAALHNISVGLIEDAVLIVSEKGLKHSKKIVHLLKQSACLGNDDAMFSLAVMLNNGVGGALDEIQSLAFFMLGILNRHVLSVMALGHRHVMGIDGAPVDKDVSYMYFKQVADQTRTDKEIHRESGIATESIRLVDEARIEAQTSEVGDLFMWLKNQAERGVASAQAELGAMLYHGAQGVKRNLQNAMNVFRDGAEMGNPDSTFNYGIMKYRGIGTKANKTEGRRLLQKAADMKNPNAVSALGWMAMEVDKNMTKAFEMFQLAKAMGHMDSGYYLGFMYHFGLVPSKSVDLDTALIEYLWSAKRDQIDAGNVYSFLLSRGTPRHRRNIHHALEWARYIAEKNAVLAKPLRNGLNAYRDGNPDLALYWYLMLADTGLEVASFNLAYLCEQNQAGVRAHISKDCEWRHYNLSTQREFQFVDAYSYIKMGDYHWYGCGGQRNVYQAARYYSLAAMKGDPQAVFNLAFMVEEGAHVSELIWLRLQIKPSIYNNKVSLLLELYARCRESRRSEAFMPCCLAWFRIWGLDVWEQYHIYMKISSFVGAVIVGATSFYLLYQLILQRRRDRGEEMRRREAEEEVERLRQENQQDI